MIQHGVAQQMAEQTAQMTAHCAQLFTEGTDELTGIVAFVEREMKGQDLGMVASNRDEFIGETFRRLFPMVIQSEECRDALANMTNVHPQFPGISTMEKHDAEDHYRMDTGMAEVLYTVSSALIGTILMVTAGHSVPKQ
ncbi:hypothetical protein SAMN05444487_11476 [Marininema mesophilum]|uniref:Uncharacterized protein n=1 Tax=Marininema mesophilum TaxID=1048340 RepID=A0A1H3AWN7_9BACL|nr:hypothetical protein [Marininema mesophilum]SDX33838.1 hypothetical protein SAMN05444487_11476 [Marininema mesophilum]